MRKKVTRSHEIIDKLKRMPDVNGVLNRHPHPIQSLAGATCTLLSVYDREEEQFWQPLWKDKIISKIECTKDCPLKIHFESGGFTVHQIALSDPIYNQEQELITIKTTTKTWKFKVQRVGGK